MDGNGSFSHGRGYAFYITRANISHRKNCRKTRLQHLRRTTKRPCECRRDVRSPIQVSTSQDETLVVESNASLQPLGSWRRPGHDENMADVVRGGFTGNPVNPRDTLQQSLTFQANNFRPAMQLDCRIVSNSLNQVT